MSYLGKASQDERWVTEMFLPMWVSGGGDSVGVEVEWRELSRMKSWANIQRLEWAYHFGGITGPYIWSNVSGAVCVLSHHVRIHIIYPFVKSKVKLQRYNETILGRDQNDHFRKVGCDFKCCENPWKVWNRAEVRSHFFCCCF